MSLRWIHSTVDIECPKCNHKNTVDLRDQEYESYPEKNSDCKMGNTIRHIRKVKAECSKCDYLIEGEIEIIEDPEGGFEGANIFGDIAKSISESDIRNMVDLSLE